MNPNKLDRINALYKKSKEEGLNEEEKAEQQQLRKEYIQLVRKNLRGTLNNTTIQYPDGSKQKLEKRYENE
jgi:uncharacterized protein YnzC (UPF0291/DUF896 family)